MDIQVDKAKEVLKFQKQKWQIGKEMEKSLLLSVKKINKFRRYKIMGCRTKKQETANIAERKGKGKVKIMRRGIFQRVMKGAVCMVLAAVVTVTGVQVPDFMGNRVTAPTVAEAATVTSQLPIVTYTRYSGNLNTYTDSTLTRRTGYICSYDQCTILKIYSNGAVQVRYPVSRGTRVAYAAMSGFFINNDFSTRTANSGARRTAYRKSSGNATIGTVFADDRVTIVGLENGRTQIIYPTSSGFKLGWIDGLYEMPTQNNDSNNNQNNNQSAYDSKVSSFINTAKWRNGASWGYYQRPTMGGGNGIGCYAYANDFIKYVYGKSGSFAGTGTAFYSPSDIRNGDVIKVTNSQHWFVVLYRNGSILTTAEGNWGGKVVVSSSAYSVSGNTLYRNGQKFRTFSVGYHYQ